MPKLSFTTFKLDFARVSFYLFLKFGSARVATKTQLFAKFAFAKRPRDIQHNDILHNDTQHNNIQHNNK